MKKILFVDNLSLDRDNPMSTCYTLKMAKIKNDERFDFYDISSDIVIDVLMYDTVVFGCRSLYLYKCYRSNNKYIIQSKNRHLAQIPAKYFIIQDMHKKTYGNINMLCQFINELGLNIIFTFYSNTEARLIRKLTPGVKHLHLMHHIDTSIFKHNSTIEKKYDILLFGAVHPTHYPFRKRLFDLILQNRDLFNVYYVEKPELFDPSICEMGLANLINESKICIATKSRYDYLVGKYFEISMCKSLIAGNIPTDGLAIFKNKIVELNEQMSNEEIISELLSALENYSTYVSRIDALYDYSNLNHGLDFFPEKLSLLVE